MSASIESDLTRELHLDHVLDVSRTLAPLRRGPGDPTTRREGHLLWRTSRMPSGAVTYVLEQPTPRSVVARAWGAGGEELLESLPRLVGAEDDPSGFVASHPVLADAWRRFPGLRVPHTGRVLEASIAAIIEQKVVGLDAFAAWRRLLLTFGEPPPGPAPSGMRVFPTAEQWTAVPSWEWHLAGVDPRRARTAQAVARVGPQLERLAESDPLDRTAVYRGLRSISGVGVWTAAEVGSRALGDADAVPFGDFHVAKDVGSALLGRRIDDQELAELLAPWSGHRFRVVRLVQLSPLARPERRGPRMPRVDHRRI